MSGLGRVGGLGGGAGLASDFEHHHHVVHLGLGRASWQGAQGHCPTISTASLPVLARRFRADLLNGLVALLCRVYTPRVRGNLLGQAAGPLACVPEGIGSIPACAGEPPRVSRKASASNWRFEPAPISVSQLKHLATCTPYPLAFAFFRLRRRYSRR